MFRSGTVIIDSGSTFIYFHDDSLLNNIRTCDPLETFSNGGGMTYTRKGTINAFPDLRSYANPDCLVNIIYLELLKEKYHIRFDSEDCNAFILDTGYEEIVFEGFGSGLYVCNLTNDVKLYDVNFLNTLDENKSFYSLREIEGVEAAREQQGQLGWPSDRE